MKIIIIAPHPDDEIIGCYSLLKSRGIHRIIYIDASTERLGYANLLGDEFGFKVNKMDFSDLGGYLSKLDDDVLVLVPDNTDRHPLHKAINAIAKMSYCRLGYYSIDMKSSFDRELSKSDQQEKRAMLNKYYPDQSSLWESNWKYFLFEGVVIDATFTTTTSS